MAFLQANWGSVAVLAGILALLLLLRNRATDAPQHQ
jgi:hypothetical protein